MTPPPTGRAVVVGTGLIGGSIGLALRARGWHVTGRDRSPGVSERALDLGALDALGEDPAADLTFVATPVGAVADAVAEALAAGPGLVTDVGSVKAPMLPLMADPRYVGGHPMAGSELEGVEGARADLFEGRTWVLTPLAGVTDDDAFARVRSVVTSFGAEVLSLPPDRHDLMVATVSHVPHLTAATLMRLADLRATEHRALLRLAAGGFRDMTRIAAGHPGIWPDICAENRDAIVAELDELVGALGEMRSIVAAGDREALVGVLEQARDARRNLPARFARPEDLAELRLTIPDRQGELARVMNLAAELGVSIVDLEIAHSVEGDAGVLILIVEATVGERLLGGLIAQGYRPTLQPLA
ncbi:MAG: prephenate dehydrogenase/arogenate dehydrogenase family protein [Acidimicrobiales bacterium]